MRTTTDNLHPAELAARQRSVVIRAVRIGFAILIVTFTMLAVFRAIDQMREFGPTEGRWLPVAVTVVSALVMIALVVVVDLLTPVKKISTIAGVLVGMLLGLLATIALSGLIDLLLQSWVSDTGAARWVSPIADSVKIIIGICLVYLGVVTVLQTQDDFRLVIPYVEFAKQIRGPRPMLVDTSALIDGRIEAIAASSFIQTPLLIPRFVLAELQALADSQDAAKRGKGRRGLDMVTRLQRLGTVDVSIDETIVPGKAVDQMLVELARAMPAIILTTDVALARVASIQSVQAININDLATATRVNLVAGDPLTVKLIRAGEQAGQGVGYLPDGTMVVAEDGGGDIGSTVAMTVSSTLQTSAGKLVFARIGERRPAEQPADQPQEQAGAEPEAATTADPPPDAGEPERPRGPFPPKPARPTRFGTPRNPRR